ncbi:fumarylacetoacetate hydrolase family protein [Streptomonospora wellingtoniae]|uniref:fumarylacetoacetase n=1 Tax=Streptomonospora wellingtoniae TaxID=3075544 RepID=A0ABU2KXW8_9ACTN|nr:fumarylacetoacetate hydrolase family protein [Streptomonospora sp. DSM 45055]MDT0304135.1 fumarylacetoacetate hydrolase family protein [Streptomonospora sp. DSM 45055]
MRTTWVPAADSAGYGADNLPYGVFARAGEPPRVGVRVGRWVLDLAGVLGDPVFAAPSLGPFMARGSTAWRATRAKVAGMLAADKGRAAAEPHLVPLSQVRLLCPFEAADYTVFQGSAEHAAAVQGLLRPGTSLPAPWFRQPSGRHGRAGALTACGRGVRRPGGQHAGPGGPTPQVGPSTRVDAEAHLGLVVGVPTSPGRRVPVSGFVEHVFGAVLVADFNARDVEAWEGLPLGPLTGSSFSVPVSPWVVPTDALGAARFAGRAQAPPPMPNLARVADWGLRVRFEVRLNGDVVSRPQYAAMYWTPDQLLAHLTANGAALRTGDLFTSGAVSGGVEGQRGSLLERESAGEAPVRLSGGAARSYLEDGDTVGIRAWARGMGGGPIRLGEVGATVLPSEE